MALNVEDFLELLCMSAKNTSGNMIRFEAWDIPCMKSEEIYFDQIEDEMTDKLKNAYVHSFHVEHVENYGIYIFVIDVEF